MPAEEFVCRKRGYENLDFISNKMNRDIKLKFGCNKQMVQGINGAYIIASTPQKFMSWRAYKDLAERDKFSPGRVKNSNLAEREQLFWG